MRKVTAQEIQQSLINYIKGGYDIVLPNYYFGRYECDVFRIQESGYTVEYEIKVSREDFFADFKKGFKGEKHCNLKAGTGFNCPNRFYFVVPKGLVKAEEVPEYAGLLTYEFGFDIKKNAKLLHKTKFTNYRKIAHQLSDRDLYSRIKIYNLQGKEPQKEIKRLEQELTYKERIIKNLNEENRELSRLNRKRIKPITDG